MSRNASLYFLADDFPTAAWESVLARFEIDVRDRPLTELDDKHCVVRRWSLDAVDGGVFLDLYRILPGRRHAPPGTHWEVSLDWQSKPGIHWWLAYAIPLLALTEFPGVIFYDCNCYSDCSLFLTCSPGDLFRRIEQLLPGFCDPSQLVSRGFTRREHPLLPRSIDAERLLAHPPLPDEECREAARQFEDELRTMVRNWRSPWRRLRRSIGGVLSWFGGTGRIAR